MLRHEVITKFELAVRFIFLTFNYWWIESVPLRKVYLGGGVWNLLDLQSGRREPGSR